MKSHKPNPVIECCHVNRTIDSHVLHFAESRFLQSVDEDNMTKQPGVSALMPFSDLFEMSLPNVTKFFF